MLLEFISCAYSRISLIRSNDLISFSVEGILSPSDIFQLVDISIAFSLFKIPAACEAAPYATSSSDFGMRISRPEKRTIVSCQILPLAPPPTKSIGDSDKIPEEF